jgi:hypothetical protein
MYCFRAVIAGDDPYRYHLAFMDPAAPGDASNRKKRGRIDLFFLFISLYRIVNPTYLSPTVDPVM